MKIAICDDEKSIRDHIEKCVREVEPEVMDHYPRPPGPLTFRFIIPI